MNTTSRGNANPVLDMMRDSYDGRDTAVSFAFAVCDTIHFHTDETVPAELKYRPSPVQHEVDRDLFPDVEIVGMLESGFITPAELVIAARCLSRYLDWTKGEDD